VRPDHDACSVPRQRAARLAVIPRLLLGLLLGIVLSTPAMMRIFAPVINSEITVMQQLDAARFSAALANGATGQQIRNLQQQLNQLEARVTADYNQWQCQLYGTGPGCQQTRPGDGVLARAAQQAYEAATQQAESLSNASNARAGLLARLNAMEKVSEASDIFAITQWLLFLLFAAIGSMPIIVRTAQVFGPQNTYEKILRIQELENIRVAVRNIKTR